MEEVQVQRRLLQEQDNSSSRATRWERATAVDIELEILDCPPVCYRPLKPPVFQCAVGHVVCSCCRASLAGRACHTCGGATSFVSRCFSVEHIVESVRVPCANAGRGCIAKTAYHGKEEHELTCPYAEGKAAVTGAGAGTGPDTPDVPEQGRGNGGNTRRNLVAGLVLLAGTTVAVPVVCSIIRHFGLPHASSCVATVAT